MSWKKVALKEICRIEKGKIGILKATTGDYPLVVTGEERKSHNEFQFDDTAVIIPLVSSTGHGDASLKRIHFQTGKFALGTILCAVIPKNKEQVSAEFLYLFLDFFKEEELVSRMKGMANVTLSVSKIAEIEIPLPSFERQIEIVRAFSEIEKLSFKIETELNNQRDLVKKLKQQLLNNAVQGKLVPQNFNDEPASALLARIKTEKAQSGKKEKPLPLITKTEIPFGIPENWVWCRLGEIAFITSGSTPSQDSFVKNGIPYLKMYNLKNQKIDFFYKPQYIKEEVHNGQLRRCRAYPGDILMNIVGPPLGKIAIIPKDLLECNFNQAAVLIRPEIKEMNFYIFWWLYEMSEINSIDTKGVAGQDNISVTQAHNIKIPLPPFTEQKRIVKKLDSLMSKCNALETHITESAALNAQLLQQVLREALKTK